MKRLIPILCISLSAIASEPFDEIESDVLDVLDEEEVIELRPEPKPTRDPFQPQCKCQCLTQGTRPRNTKTFAGKIENGACVCPCLEKK